MSKSVGTLDYRSDHYWVVDITGQDDYDLQSGDSTEVWIDAHWLFTRIDSYSDSWRPLWRFLDENGTMVIPHLGMRGQL
jgi:hypothetical protein